MKGLSFWERLNKLLFKRLSLTPQLLFIRPVWQKDFISFEKSKSLKTRRKMRFDSEKIYLHKSDKRI